MREYELVYIMKADLPAEKTARIKEKVMKILNDNKSVIKADLDWGRKKLAYPIEAINFGQYFFINFEGDGTFIPELERTLKYDEDVLRFLTVRMDEIKEKTRTGELKRVHQMEEGRLRTDEPRPFIPRGDRGDRGDREGGYHKKTENTAPAAAVAPASTGGDNAS